MAGLLQKQLKKLPPLPSIAVCFLLFLLTYKFQLHFYEVKYLFWLGFPSAAFSSSDYFPILPWLFMFFCGFFIGNYFKEKGFPKVLEKKRCPPLGFTGRHALIIYIVHQPIVFALCTFLEVIL
ncbi:MAG: heparan-alpha-glucosaminide N-acetyltransferase domain-containing protein, partial [Oscillospiraceae bacterium]